MYYKIILKSKITLKTTWKRNNERISTESKVNEEKVNRIEKVRKLITGLRFIKDRKKHTR